MSNRRKIKNNKNNKNNDKVNNPTVDVLKNFNLPTTLMIKLNKNSGPMYVDFGTKKDMEDYINLFNKLLEVFYLVYDLNKEWGDLL